MLSQHGFVAILEKKRRRCWIEGIPCSNRSENLFLGVELSKDLEKNKIEKIEIFFRDEILFLKKNLRFFAKNRENPLVKF